MTENPEKLENLGKLKMTILISRKKIDARVDSMVEKVTNVSILLFWFQTLNSSVVNDACIMSAALRPA